MTVRSTAVAKREAADLAGVTPEVQTRGGEFHPARRQKVVELAPASGQMALALTAPVGPNLSESDRKEAERRYGVIEPIVDGDRFPLLRSQYTTRAALMEYLSTAHKVKVRTLYRWLSLYRTGGLPALVDRDRADKGVPRVMTPAALDFLLAVALPRKGVSGTYSVAEMFRAYEEERAWRVRHVGKAMGDFESCKYARYIDEDGKLRASALLPEVSRETFRLWYLRIPEIVRVMARDGEEAFSNSQEVLSWRDLSALAPMEYVVMDHRRLDVFCLAQDITSKSGWRLIRPWLTAAIDMRTRKWLGWVVVETPSSDSIAAVLRRVFLQFGLPVSVYWDNGKDFRCEWLEGGRAAHEIRPAVGELDTTWRGVLGTLDVRVVHAIAYRARAKVIEPNFGRISKFDQTLPWWVGHKPEARPERLEDLVRQHEQWVAGERDDAVFPTIAQIADLYDRAIADLNERDLEGEGMRAVKVPSGYRWMCPNEAWEKLIGAVPRRAVPAEVIHMCFARRRTITIRHGEAKITMNGQPYHYRMANPAELMRLNGIEVELAYDPLDMGDGALYYQDRFLGLVHCAELRRMGEREFVEDEKTRRAGRREVKRFIAAVHDALPVAGPVERLARREAVRPQRVEVARPAAAAAIAPAIVEATAAKLAENAPVAAIELAVERAPEPASADDEFDFFGA